MFTEGCKKNVVLFFFFFFSEASLNSLDWSYEDWTAILNASALIGSRGPLT